jgi:hypothetical protein
VQAVLADDREPRAVRHLARGCTWEVLDVPESWTYPEWPQHTRGRPAITRRYRLLVLGPVPGELGRDGERIMVATEYGDRVGWWIRPGDRPPVREHHRPG